MAHEDKLARFVRRAVVPTTGYTRLSLIQSLAAGGSNVIRNIELTPQQYGYDEAKVSEMVAEMLSTAQEDADGHMGVSTYCIKAFKGVTLGERSPFFRLRSQDFDDNEALGETEGPTKDGQIAQTQRHLEVVMRQFVQQTEIMSNQSSNVIARLTEQVKHYEDKHFETVIRLEELLTEKHERELASLREMGKEKRLDEALKTFKPLVPVLMAKFKGTPAEAKPGLYMESLKEILKQVNPEDMGKIAEILGPKSLALATIYMDAHKEDETPNDESTSEKAHGH